MLGDDRHTQEDHVMREVEVGEMKPQAKGCRNCQKAMGSKEAVGKDSSRTPYELQGNCGPASP